MSGNNFQREVVPSRALPLPSPSTTSRPGKPIRVDSNNSNASAISATTFMMLEIDETKNMLPPSPLETQSSTVSASHSPADTATNLSLETLHEYPPFLNASVVSGNDNNDINNTNDPNMDQNRNTKHAPVIIDLMDDPHHVMHLEDKLMSLEDYDLGRLPSPLPLHSDQQHSSALQPQSEKRHVKIAKKLFSFAKQSSRDEGVDAPPSISTTAVGSGSGPGSGSGTSPSVLKKIGSSIKRRVSSQELMNKGKPGKQ